MLLLGNDRDRAVRRQGAPAVSADGTFGWLPFTHEGSHSRDAERAGGLAAAGPQYGTNGLRGWSTHSFTLGRCQFASAYRFTFGST